MLLSSTITSAFILIASASLLTIVVFFFLLFMQHVRKREEHTKQIEIMKSAYKEAELQSQLEIQEQTLRSISHEIHDNIGQILSLVSLNLNTIEAIDQTNVQTTSDLVEKAITDLRGLSKSLNPDRIQQGGLYNTLKIDLDYIEKSKKLSTDLHIDENFPEFSPDKTIIIYRIIQEIINNCIKHAKATNLSIAMLYNKEVPTIIIEDNGLGFNFIEANNSGLGLQTIQYRAAILKATIDVNTTIGNGTKVSLILN